MLRFLFVRILVPLLLILFLRSLIRSILTALRGSSVGRPQAQNPVTVSPGGELKKDPVCGTYVSTATSISRKVNGGIVYFCSKECRDRYRVA